LRRTGYQAHSETFTRDKQTLHRVIVPGYHNATDAKFAASSIGKQIEGVKPRVLAPSGVEEDAQLNPDTSIARWTIQVGSFSQAGNSRSLVAKLQQANYQAFTELSGSVHKVMVGPFVSRTNAEKQRDEIKSKLKLNGIIREQP